MRPRVLLCADTPNWAFDNICDQIIRHHGDRFEFDRYYMAGVLGQPQVFLNQVFAIGGPYDIVHFFWREDVQHLLNPEAVFRSATTMRIRPEDVFGSIARTVITSSVYDHLFLEPAHFPWRAQAFWFMDGYSVSSNLLDRIYRGIDAFPDPIAVIPDGVDTDRFRPRRGERFVEGERPMRVGWVGNSSWGTDQLNDPKGLHSILTPAIAQLKAEGVAVEPHYADATVRLRSRDEMVDYYAEIDVLVCASEIEGTPNPVLEAMASGVPVVSTRVGIVPEALGPMQQDFLLPERSVPAMAAALRRLAADRTLLPALGRENLAQVAGWTWAETTRAWPGFWEAAMARHREGRRGPLKEHLLRERYAAWYSENIRHKNTWGIAAGRARRSFHELAVEWIYRTPERAAFINRLRGRR